MVVNMIKAEVVLDTIWNGKRITTLHCHFPRFILAQVNTHRMFSRNTASSRAVPIQKMIDRINSEPVIPVHWGKNQAGMQASEEVDAETKEKALQEWRLAALNASKTAEKLLELGLHKQIANRILEPFMWAETIVTATEWDNFFKLRLHEDSQPEIQELARCMKEAMDKSVPVESQVHLPYITYDELNQASKETPEDMFLKLAPLSAARCARVSYLNHEGKTPNPDKDMETFQKLKSGGHWSPMEHQALAITEPDFFVLDCDYNPITDEVSEVFAGVTEPNEIRCRNFIGWQQARTLYEN